MKLIQAGCSIECEKCKIIARKVIPSSVLQDSKIGRYIKYNCQRNSSAENLKELNPKKEKYRKGSNLDINTKLQAKDMYPFGKLHIDFTGYSGNFCRRWLSLG